MAPRKSKILAQSGQQCSIKKTGTIRHSHCWYSNIRQQRNVALDRVIFEERKQEEGEMFDTFYVSLKEIAGDADLCTDLCISVSRVSYRVCVTLVLARS